jgi:hypothetical protein
MLRRSRMLIMLSFLAFFFTNCDGVLGPPKALKKCANCLGGSSFSGAGIIGNTYPAGNSVQLSTAQVGNYRGFGGAFDRANRVFVIVYGNGPVGGLFLNDDGNQIGSGFTLPTVNVWSQLPRVACSNSGSCLAVWHDSRGGQPQVYGRVLRYSAGGIAQMGADFLIGGWLTMQEGPPGIAFSPEAGEYLVSWNQQKTYAQRVSAEGQLNGGLLTITDENIWTEQSAVAYSPVNRSFGIVTMKSRPDERGQIVFRSVQAGTGALLTGQILLDDNMGVAKITDIEWDTGAQKFYAGWWGGVGGGLVDSNGNFAAGNIILGNSYDGYDFAYNEYTQTIFGIYHGPSAEDWGNEGDRHFQAGNSYEVTNVGAVNGAYVPKVVAHPFKPFWIVITTRDYNALFMQKVVRE